MPIGIYDTITLAQVVRNLKLPSQFLVTAFFPNVIEYETREFAIDVDAGKRRLAPFVSPLVQGKAVESRGITTKLFAPAYIKDKRVLDPTRPVMRSPGERIGGGLSPIEREMANIAFEMEDQVQMIDRRMEWLAANILLNGRVTISGEGYPPVVVDYQRDADLTVSLPNDTQWTVANIGTPLTPGTVSPAEDLEGWATTILEKSGAVADTVVFTKKSWNAFVRDPRVREAIWFPRAGDSLINLGAGIKTGALYKGHWGFFALWLYNDWFVAPDIDVHQPMLPDGTVIVGSSDMQGVRAFGAIIDPEFAYGAMAYAPKSWIEHDPATRILMMQSAPMVVPSRVNAAMCITVC